MRLDMEISKSSVLLVNEHQSDQKNVTNDFCIHFPVSGAVLDCTDS